jgi:cystathionine beta-lyase/cystathionine gamma-synthase
VSIEGYLDPARCPDERPAVSQMSAPTRQLHEAIDDRIRQAKVPYLHPDGPTLQLDMISSVDVRAWQEGKASKLFMGDGCWSELPHLYARYGTGAGADLLAAVRNLEAAKAAVLADCGMQATALCFDALMSPGSHAICFRQVYNKSRSYLEHLAGRIGGSVTVIDDGDVGALADAVKPETALVFCETFTNPRMRAQDPVALVAAVADAQSTARGIKLVIDDTIATPWGLKTPLLEHGVDVVIASGTKALGGQDRDMWGYVASDDMDFANQVMDLVALRGGQLDWRRAAILVQNLDEAERAHAGRCESASRIASWLTSHPRIEQVLHPSLADHPDAAVIAANYARPGSLMAFRIRDADETATGHFCDVLATTKAVRYALSFDGPTTKVNHHKTVSEYFTPPERLAAGGLDRLVRLAVGHESANDLIACLNWSLHHAAAITPEALATWRNGRLAELGLSR